MNKEWLNISKLIASYLSGTITPEEEAELDAWRNASLKNEQLFTRLIDEKNIEKYKIEIQAFDPEAAWKVLQKRRRTVGRSRIIQLFSKYAAILLIPLLIGVFVFVRSNRTSESDIETESTLITDFKPGEKKARLILDNNKVVTLDSLANQTLYDKDGTMVEASSGMLSYNSKTGKAKKKETVYHTLDIPHGGEYQLTLSDGTKVYLNAMSSLRFPVTFSQDVRRVEVTGEAYFEVAQSEIPFVVQTSNVQIEVLGTAFNISTYENEPCRTTLVSGSVKLHAPGGEEAILKPSEQAVYNPIEEDFAVRSVDVFRYTSWVKGKIICKDEPLEVIMKKLARWYDIDVKYADEATKKIRFGCNVNRYQNIEPFLELLESTKKLTVKKEGKIIELKRVN